MNREDDNVYETLVLRKIMKPVEELSKNATKSQVFDIVFPTSNIRGMTVAFQDIFNKLGY